MRRLVIPLVFLVLPVSACAKSAAGPGVRVEKHGDRIVVNTSAIMKWFRDDFEKWGGGEESFLRRYLPQDKATRLSSSSDVAIEYDEYDWTLNDWRR